MQRHPNITYPKMILCNWHRKQFIYFWKAFTNKRRRYIWVVRQVQCRGPMYLAYFQSIKAFGGNSLWVRMYRTYFETKRALNDMWKGNPVLTSVIFGLPLGFLSLIMYSIWCADILDADDDDEQGLDERFFFFFANDILLKLNFLCRFTRKARVRRVLNR